jgi:hypothetical protein
VRNVEFDGLGVIVIVAFEAMLGSMSRAVRTRSGFCNRLSSTSRSPAELDDPDLLT